ncbi:ABC transporter permease [Halosolutus amylolyticus]|uniref:ABC transporter permease n=1 Tax=Halosolutus amylolyticus TaxID=2932267 RepID=A0ABD5PIH0_9EURY|nr:ABC transporter permease [Halosolutus amylolyticus]
MKQYSHWIDRLKQFKRSDDRTGLLFVVGIPFTVLLLFFIIPLFLMVRLSFLEDMPPAAYTLENYVAIFTEGVYVDVILFTLYVTVITTAVVITLGYVLAYSIIYFSRKTTFLLLMVILPFWVNYIVRMYAWINILQTDGLINWIESLLFSSDPSGYMFTTTAVLIGFVYIWLPLSTLPIYASIQGLDDNLKEAAKDLGAGPIRTFFTVTLPQTKSGVIAGTILVFIPTFGAFITPSMLGGTDHLMVGMVIETQFNQVGNWPLAAAMGTVLTVIVVALLVVGSYFSDDVAGGIGGSDK